MEADTGGGLKFFHYPPKERIMKFSDNLNRPASWYGTQGPYIPDEPPADGPGGDYDLGDGVELDVAGGLIFYRGEPSLITIEDFETYNLKEVLKDDPQMYEDMLDDCLRNGHCDYDRERYNQFHRWDY